MALKKEIVKEVYGRSLFFEDAYIQITEVVGNKNNMNIEVAIFTDETKVALLGINRYDFCPSTDEFSENFIKQGYEYLKTLEEYIDAVDC